MAEEFERLMNEKMEQASISDVMPGFDKTQVWQQLQPRLHKKKIYALYRYLPYAAILLLGIIIGRLVMHPSPTSITIVQGTHPAQQLQQQIIVATTPDKVPVKNTTNTIVQHNYKPSFRNKHINPQPSPAPVTQIPVQEVVVQNKASQQQPQQTPVVTKAPIQRVHAVHLLDIDNEDKGIVVTTYKTTVMATDRVISLFVFRNVPDGMGSNTPHPDFKSILKN